MAAYWEQLKDPRWQKMRLEVMGRADFKCEQCGDGSNTLNVHHSHYEKGCAPWEYPPESLHCLCEKCHGTFDYLRVWINRSIGCLPLSRLRELYGVIIGLDIESNPSKSIANNPPEGVVIGMLRVFLTDHGEVQSHLNYFRSHCDGARLTRERIVDPTLLASRIKSERKRFRVRSYVVS